MSQQSRTIVVIGDLFVDILKVFPIYLLVQMTREVFFVFLMLKVDLVQISEYLFQVFDAKEQNKQENTFFRA